MPSVVTTHIESDSHSQQVRMGKGKGSFDHWASRIAVSKVIFELKGDIHEQVARDAFRLAGNKMPGETISHCNYLKCGFEKILTNKSKVCTSL